MEFRHIDGCENHPLIDHFYQLKICKEDLPFTSLIVPIGQTDITYVFSNHKQEYHLDERVIKLNNLILTGQIYGHYNFIVNHESDNIGFALRPTALYKILNKDISEFNNLHLQLKKVSEYLHEQLAPIFINNYNDDKSFVKGIIDFFDNFELSNDKNIHHIDKAVNLILERDGLITVNELLEEIHLSQKTLETLFKKIVGFTPGKYIKQSRFLSLMRKYQSKESNLKSLLYEFNYYDQSHFSRDFKFFTGQSPREYFKKDFPLIEQYLTE